MDDQPRGVTSVSLPADHFDRIYADALAKLAEAVRTRRWVDPICVWCGLPSGEVPRSCAHHGQPRGAFPDEPTAADVYAATMAKLAPAWPRRRLG